MTEKHEFNGRELEISNESTVDPNLEGIVKRAILDFFHEFHLAHKLKKMSVILADSDNSGIFSGDVHVFGKYDKGKKSIFVYMKPLELGITQGLYRNESEISYHVKGTLAHETAHAIEDEVYHLERFATMVSEKLKHRVNKITSEIDILKKSERSSDLSGFLSVISDFRRTFLDKILDEGICTFIGEYAGGKITFDESLFLAWYRLAAEEIQGFLRSYDQLIAAYKLLATGH